jgi:hypothetical protein
MHFCMKWLRTLNSFQISQIKIKKSKTFCIWCPFPGLSNGTTLMQIQSGWTVPLKKSLICKSSVKGFLYFTNFSVKPVENTMFMNNQRPNSWTKCRQSLKSFPPCYSQAPIHAVFLEISISSNSCNLLQFLQCVNVHCKRERRKTW